MRKSGGTAEGAAFVGWNGTYSFNATGRRIPLESVKAMAYPQAPLTGLLEFNADGTGTFEVPRYQFRGRIRDLFVADEGVGEVTGRLDVRGDSMTIEIEAASPRLAVSGTGRIDLTETQNADLTLRFTDTSLDPYARAFEKRFSPFTTAVGSGTLRVIGELANPDRLVVDVMFDQLQIRTFDYPLRNAKPIRVLMHNNVVRIDDMQFVGDGTELDVTGTMDLNARRVAGLARGTANLGILQGFYRNIRSSGNAQLTAQVSGSLDAPIILGRATIDNGRLRYFSLPHSLEAVNGTILFDSRNIRLDGLTARVADGQVSFDGRDRPRRLRAGGSFADRDRPEHAPAVSRRRSLGSRRRPFADGARDGAGAVGNGDRAERGMDDEVRHGRQPVRFRRRCRRRHAHRRPRRPPNSNMPPVRLDVRVIAPGTLRIENNDANIVSSADLTFRGTYERPDCLRQRGDLARRVHLRRPPLRRHARPARFHEPGAHRADVRHRRRDAGARAPADLSHHAERVGHDAAAAAGVQLGSAAAAGRRRVAAARRPCDRGGRRSPGAVAPRHHRAAARAGARGAHAGEPHLRPDRRGRRTDVRRRYVSADAARERSDAAVVALQSRPRVSRSASASRTART